MTNVYQILIESCEDLSSEIERHKDNPNTFLFFTGALGPSCESWCDDCTDADPIIEKGLELAPKGSVFILCVVGDKDSWNDPNNPFKHHPTIKFREIPSLMRLSTKELLGPEECKKSECVNPFFRG
ncbi:thioredoxin domain-containing protein 17-like [Glandiceps talaboti]